MLSLFYVGQVDLIKTTRKALKTKIRNIVDKLGPKVFKNFDKMRLIMLDPTATKKASRASGGEKKKYMSRSLSNMNTNNMNKNNSIKENMIDSNLLNVSAHDRLDRAPRARIGSSMMNSDSQSMQHTPS